jgi:hypothetical protein
MRNTNTKLSRFEMPSKEKLKPDFPNLRKQLKPPTRPLRQDHHNHMVDYSLRAPGIHPKGFNNGHCHQFNSLHATILNNAQSVSFSKPPETSRNYKGDPPFPVLLSLVMIISDCCVDEVTTASQTPHSVI